MSPARALILSCCASARLLAQHEGHGAPGGGVAPPRVQVSAFLRYIDHGTPRGDRQIALTDWEAFQIQRPLANTSLTLRAMTSLGALVNGGEGTPLLLQTGGSYRHGYVHDRQHPDDVLMEASATLGVPVTAGASFSIYLAPVGAPALGPMPYMHRPSAAADPVAPIGHHWQDASHISHGVLSAIARSRRVTLEASAFNGRESDFESPWPDFSHARLDSYAGRVGVDLHPVSVGGWWGYLKEHDPIARAMQMHRIGASVSLAAAGLRGGSWSSLAVYGVNVHHHDGQSHLLLHGDPGASPHVRSSSVLLESSLGIGLRHTVFSRLERVFKNGEELGFFGGDLMTPYDIRTVAIGATRALGSMRSARFVVGGRGSVNFVPASLELTYGTRRPAGFEGFVRAARP